MALWLFYRHRNNRRHLRLTVMALPPQQRLAAAADQSSLTATELIEFQSIKRRNGDAMRHAQRAVASNLIELHLSPAKSDQKIKPADADHRVHREMIVGSGEVGNTIITR